MRRFRFQRTAALWLGVVLLLGPGPLWGQVNVERLHHGESSRLALLEAKSSLLEAEAAVQAALLEVERALAAVEAAEFRGGTLNQLALEESNVPPFQVWQSRLKWVQGKLVDTCQGAAQTVRARVENLERAVEAKAAAQPAVVEADAEDTGLEYAKAQFAAAQEDTATLAPETLAPATQNDGAPWLFQPLTDLDDAASVVEALGELQEDFLRAGLILPTHTAPSSDGGPAPSETPQDAGAFLPAETRRGCQDEPLPQHGKF